MHFSNLIVFLFLLLSSVCPINSAIFTVTNTSDSGVGSLRQAIFDVNSSGDITNNIEVALSGTDGDITIFILSELPSITNQVTLSGLDLISGEKLIIDGSLILNVSRGLEINGAAASNSAIIDIVIKNISVESILLDISGILITNLAENCSVEGVVISDISQNFAGGLRGIYVHQTALNCGNIQNNYIVNITVTSNVFASFSSYGIQINGDVGTLLSPADCSNNSIVNVSAGDAFINDRFFCIHAQNIYGNCNNNIINMVEFEGITLVGITVENNLYGICSGNRISDFMGQSDLSGIRIGTVRGDINANEITNFLGKSCIGVVIEDTENIHVANNIIDQFSTISRSMMEKSSGIFISSAPFGVTVHGNCISQFDIAEDIVRGIEISEAYEPIIECNIISNLSAEANGFFDTISSGIFLGVTSGAKCIKNLIQSVSAKEGGIAHGIFCSTTTDGLFEKNIIKNVTAESLQSYGITIGDINSVHNNILTNSISSIDTATIFYPDNTQTDGVIELTSIQCKGRFITISGILTPASDFFEANFLLQFFVSSLSSPPQTESFIGKRIIAVNYMGTTPFTVTFEPATKILDGHFITATATALPSGIESNNNTSEVSSVLVGCPTSSSGLCNLVSICPDNVAVDCPVSNCGVLPCLSHKALEISDS